MNDKDLVEFFIYLRDYCYNRDFQIAPEKVVECFREHQFERLHKHSVMQAEGSDEHICKYCGVLTSQPDEDCYKNPNRVQGAAVGNSADGKGVSDGCKHDPYYFMDELLCSKCSARIR